MEEFTVEHDGNHIFGKAFIPSGKGPWPVVIFSHGFGASHAYDSGMEQIFNDHGFAFVAFDFCGGGLESQSSGTMLEMSVLTESNDLSTIIDWTRVQERIDPSKLFLLGSSQGGYVSTFVASKRPDDVAALALFFPAFNIGDDARARIAMRDGEIPDTMQIGPHVVGRRYNEDALAIDIFECMRRYFGDVLIIHGVLDEIVPLDYSRKALGAFGGSCKLETIQELGHGFRNCPIELHDHLLDRAIEFFEEHL